MPETNPKLNSRFVKAFGALAAGLLAASSAQGAVATSCPGKWQGKTLVALGIMDGPPRDNASLHPTSITDIKGGFVSKWTLEPNPRGYFVRCDYGTIKLEKQLPASVKACQVRYDLKQKPLLNGQQPLCR